MSILELLLIALVCVPIGLFGLVINFGAPALVWYCARKSVVRIYP